jgi:hypothetical protein
LYVGAGFSRPEGFGQAEVEHLHHAVCPHLDVRGLEIAVDDALLVRRLKGLANLLRDRQRLVHRDGALRDAVGEGRALDQLHHERVRAAGLLEAVDRGDVGMIQRRQGLRLALEAGEAVRVRANASGSTLIATWRPRLVSVAR